MEHSGTTLVSDLLRQTNKFASGFEGGVLLGRSPKTFEKITPFYENMLAGWSISRDQLERCCDTDDFNEFYARLKTETPLLNERQDLFDKTPRYATELSEIAGKTNAPILFIYKDPRASVFSDFKRANKSNFEQWFEGYAQRKLVYMRRCYEGYKTAQKLESRALVFSLEDLCFSSRETATSLYDIIGEPFCIDYLLLKNLKYKNTKSKFISADLVLEYKLGFSSNQTKLIENTFFEFGDWFYS